MTMQPFYALCITSLVRLYISVCSLQSTADGVHGASGALVAQAVILDFNAEIGRVQIHTPPGLANIVMGNQGTTDYVSLEHVPVSVNDLSFSKGL